MTSKMEEEDSSEEINNKKVVTHEELALLWTLAEEAVKCRKRKRKYLGLLPAESKEQYLERAWKGYHVYVEYFESLILKYIGPSAKHRDWAIDQHTGRLKPRNG